VKKRAKQRNERSRRRQTAQSVVGAGPLPRGPVSGGLFDIAESPDARSAHGDFLCNVVGKLPLRCGSEVIASLIDTTHQTA
jgi:hypothetical protein